MYSLYTDFDIMEFLKKNNLYWNGAQLNELYPEKDKMMHIEVRKISSKPTQENLFQKLPIFLEVNALTFKIYTEEKEVDGKFMREYRKQKIDLSLEWIENLVKKYPLAKGRLLTLLDQKEKDICQSTESEISALQAKIKELQAQESTLLKPLNSIRIMLDEKFPNEKN